MLKAVAPTRRFPLSRRAAGLLVAGAGVVLIGFVFRGALGIGQAAKQPAMDPMTAELLRAAERADLCMTTNAVGVGLRGEYFAEADLRGTPVLVRVDELVDFDRTIQQPGEAGTQRVQSARWTGWIKAPISGQYRFHADAPGMRVMVSRNLVAGEGAPPDAKVDLAAGRFYPVEMAVSQITDSDARMRLEWTAPHGARYVVPRSLLQLPTDTVPARP
jgi:hypothetical protein